MRRVVLQRLSLDAKHLLQGGHDLHQVRLRGHDGIDVLVGGRRFVEHPVVLAAFHARGRLFVIGHREAPGRPALYATTKLFLDDLGLESLDQLPLMQSPGQMADMLESLETTPQGQPRDDSFSSLQQDQASGELFTPSPEPS